LQINRVYKDDKKPKIRVSKPSGDAERWGPKSAGLHRPFRSRGGPSGTPTVLVEYEAHRSTRAQDQEEQQTGLKGMADRAGYVPARTISGLVIVK
jgi:hypothetical protein